MNDEDELSGIFDDLNPNDFSGVTSTLAREEPFKDFLERNIATLRISFLAVDGLELNPIAILCNDATEWTYTPENEESLGEYFERLRAEAIRLNAKRFFISRTTKVGKLPEDSTSDAADLEVAQSQLKKNELVDGMFFFAMEKADDGWVSTHGIMVSYGNRLGEVQTGDSSQSVALLERILNTDLP